MSTAIERLDHLGKVFEASRLSQDQSAGALAFIVGALLGADEHHVPIDDAMWLDMVSSSVTAVTAR